MQTDQPDYCYTFHNIETLAVREPFAFTGNLPALMGVCLDPETDRVVLLCYYPIFSRLPFVARLAILKHEAIHIIDGHLSSLGIELRKEYGELANIAMDLYVNQKFDVQPIIDVGLHPMLIADFQFPPNLSSSEYAAMLRKLQNEGDPRLQFSETYIVCDSKSGAGGGMVDQNGNPVAGEIPQDPQAGTAGKPGDPFTGQGSGQYRASEVFDITEKEAAAANQATDEIRNNVSEALKADKKEFSRGFQGADYEESIEASKRQSEVPWSYYLRMMETRHRAAVSTPTRRRLSRRSPFHLGRIRRYGLEVVFMVDTSGSMGQQQLRLVDPELRGLHARGAHITVIHCDAAVAKVHEYSPHKPLEEFSGRGGTDFSPALLQVRELFPQPSLFIGYTDGYGGVEAYVSEVKKTYGSSWYDDYVAQTPSVSPDGIETLWLIPEGCMKPDEFKAQIVPWGNVVVIKDDGAVEKEQPL
jgi:predicted metal-dependent peptidase